MIIVLLKPFHFSQHTSPRTLTGGRLNSHANCCSETKPPFLIEKKLLQSESSVSTLCAIKVRIGQPSANQGRLTAKCSSCHVHSTLAAGEPTPFPLSADAELVHTVQYDLTKSAV